MWKRLKEFFDLVSDSKYDHYSADYWLLISNISEHENVIHWLWMSDILYMYVLCVEILSDVARSWFVAVKF